MHLVVVVGAKTCFILNVCDCDFRLALELSRRIKSLYPDALLIAVGDGLDPSGLEPDLSVTGERIKLARFGAEWTKRWMRLALESGRERVIKIDPDAWLYRRFGFFPLSQIGGTLACNIPCQIPIVRGGCIYYHSSAIAQILNSSLLDDERFINGYCFSYYRYSQFRKPGELVSNELLYSEDTTIGYVAQQLELACEHWPEVCIGFRESPPDNSDLVFAATHPRE